ncbi:hypothetical protein F2Q70_00037727 [Brassica cretica]|uniref:EGF-like calcium-binding domain-containing protein n=1 Tax=Brassica cretica TaxID=69181 RepID=A0A8S9K0S5_BRACR|nr:hypothetical protein F2Q70_00037727 [Brassica cretica]
MTEPLFVYKDDLSFFPCFFCCCQNDHLKGCKCPPGFSGDGLKNCTDVNECEEKTVCQCRGCKCKNTWGSYECNCNGSLLYIREHDICIKGPPEDHRRKQQTLKLHHEPSEPRPLQLANLGRGWQRHIPNLWLTSDRRPRL